MTKTIHEIWSGVLASDSQSWRELVNLYAGLVYTIARRAGLNTADAEDCAQFVWINLYKRRHSLRDPIALPAWLIRTTHRRAISMKMRTSRQAAYTEDLELLSSKLPDAEVNAIEESALVEIALNQLDERCRQLLQELYFNPEQKSYHQIAQELKVKLNSLGPLRSRCLERLRKILENLGWQAD